MKPCRFATVVLTTLLACGTGPRVYADGLVQQFGSLFGPGGLELDSRVHTGHFASGSAVLLFQLNEAQQFAAAAADFPAVSTVPGLTFRYNPELQAFERSSGSLGPVYVERPQTIGRGKLDVGFSYLFQDFDKLDGDSLDGRSFRLFHSDCCSGPSGLGLDPPPDGKLTLGELDTLDITFDKIDLSRMCCRCTVPTGSPTSGTSTCCYRSSLRLWT